jgi:type I restriction enzyme, S subunit
MRGSAEEYQGYIMRTGWQEKSVGDILKLEYGKPLDESDRKPSGRFPVYGANGEKGRTDKCYYHKPSIIVGRKGSAGEINLTENKFWPLDVTYFVTFDEHQHDLRFLYYLLKTLELTKLAKGVKPGINRNAVYALVVKIPPLPEQQRIVEVLDEAFAGIATAKANAEKNLRNAHALFKSHLQTVVTQSGKGWVEKTLESCCGQIFAGGDVPKDRFSKERTLKYSVPIFANGEQDDGLYGFTDVARVTKPSVTVSARGTLGFTAIRTEPFLPVVRLIVLVPDEKQISLSFLYYAVVGMDFGNTGTSIPQLTVPNFKESKLRVPSLSEQKAIVEKLDAIREETQRLASLYERKLAALKALKKSLLHQAFTGEL